MAYDPHTYYRLRRDGRPVYVRQTRAATPVTLGAGERVNRDGSRWEGKVNGRLSREVVVWTEDDALVPMALDLHYGELVEVAA